MGLSTEVLSHYDLCVGEMLNPKFTHSETSNIFDSFNTRIDHI